MKRRLGLVSIVVFALEAGVVGGGVTSSLADEARVEADIGDVRGAVLSLFAPVGAVATETNPKLQGRCGARACGSSLAPPPRTGQATTKR